MNENQNQIKDCHLRFAEERGDDKTYCPSEVARVVFSDNWRDKMEVVRIVADTLVKNGTIDVLEKGVIKNELPSKIKGPIRLQIKS